MLNKFIDNLEIGIDEAGRGSLIGRVYAAAVIWNIDFDNKNIIDSKKLTSKKRLEQDIWIKNNVHAWGIGWAENDEIDKLNILKATEIAMERAINNLKIQFNLNEHINILIIDGLGWNNKFSNYNTYSVIKGDNKLYSIAAASILAKVAHDNYIIDLCIENNDLNDKYNLLKNMGYGTKKHINGIINYGVTKYHRISFKPCSTIIQNLI